MFVNSFNSMITPNVFLREAAPAAAIRGSGIGTIGVVVQSIRGLVGVPTVVSDLSDYTRKFGDYDVAIKDDFMYVYNMLKQGADSLMVVRAVDGTAVVASGTVQGTTFTLKSGGTWGNAVTLTIAASTVSGYVDLSFKYGAKEQYDYKQVQFTSTTGTRYFKDVIEAAPDDFVNVLVAGTVNPSGQVVSFAGGTNGTTVGSAAADSIYVGTNASGGLTGLVAFEAEDSVNFVCSARNTDTVNAALLAHVAIAGVTPRMAIVSPASGKTVSEMVTLMATYNQDQVIMTYPWLQVVNPYNNKKEYHAPSSFYAGLLSTLSYEQSPSRKQILGVIGSERSLTNAEVDTLTSNRVSPITLISGQGFVVRNGYNTSSNPARQNITRRRAVNFFATAFEAGSQQFVSRPHTEALRNDIKRAFGSLIENELAVGKIGNVNGGKVYAVKCDSQNNPNEVVRANRCMVDIQISLLAPADFIAVTLDASEAKVVDTQ